MFCAICSKRFVTTSARALSFSTFSPACRDSPTSFPQLGLPPALLSALGVAFPHVQQPTPSQTALLQALVPDSKRCVAGSRDRGGRSLILRDVTGSGKSLSLLLGLLSHSGTRKKRLKRKSQLANIEQLLLVPHTEVARQYEYWLELLRAAATSPSSSSINSNKVNTVADWLAPKARSAQQDAELHETPAQAAFPNAQVTYRGQASPVVISPSTDLLVSTPAAFLEQLPSLELSALRTIALDEADSMLSLPGRFSTHQEIRKWERHPPLLMSIMQELLTDSHSSAAAARRPKTEKSRAGQAQETVEGSMRIVAVSATANSVFRDWLVRRSGWIGSRGILGEKQIDWYDFSGEEGDQISSGAQETVYEKVGKGLLPNAEVQHLLYRIDEKGDLQDASSPVEGELGSSAPLVSKHGKVDLEPSFLALSTIFALEEVVSGLVLIPSSQSLPKTLDYFHSLSIPATTLAEAQDLPADEPRLYVVSVDAVRGLDIPNLSHVFILPGTVEDSSSYLHIAGRVGRLGYGGKRKKGKVISLVRADVDRDERRIRRYWELLGIEGKEGRSLQE